MGVLISRYCTADIHITATSRSCFSLSPPCKSICIGGVPRNCTAWHCVPLHLMGWWIFLLFHLSSVFWSFVESSNLDSPSHGSLNKSDCPRSLLLHGTKTHADHVNTAPENYLSLDSSWATFLKLVDVTKSIPWLSVRQLVNNRDPRVDWHHIYTSHPQPIH